MWLRKLRTISLAVLLIGGTTGGLGVGPLALGRVEAVHPRRWGGTGIRPGGGRRAGPGRRIGPATGAAAGLRNRSRPGMTSASPIARLACDDGPPAYCPISMAANAFSKVVGYFHSSQPVDDSVPAAIGQSAHCWRG